MRLIAFILFAFTVALPAHAQERLDGPMRPEILTWGELRFLQAALAYEGHYTGLLDGKWGPGSQGAINESADGGTATWRHAALLARKFRKIMERDGWQPTLHGPTNLSAHLPMARIQVKREGADALAAMPDGGLRVRSVLGSALATTNIHALIVANAPNLKPDYSLMRADRMVTSTRLNNGRHSYARSDLRGGQFGTMVVTWDSENAKYARVIVASITSGGQPALNLQTDGVLQVMINRLDKPADPVKPPKPDSPRAGALAGTAFYINNTDLVTSEDAYGRCAKVGLADGTTLTRLTRFRDQGLVVLTSPRRSDAWLPLGLPQVPDVGDALRVLRAERQPGRSPALQSRQGSVITTLKFDDGGVRLLVGVGTTPAQTGAPVLNAANHVVGVVVGPPDQAEASLLQQLGFATPAIRLASGLKRKQILFDQLGDSPAASPLPTDGAVVPLLCQ